MPRGPGRLQCKEVPVGVMEQACRDPRNLRVGATTDPLQRASQYERVGANGYYFVGQFLFCQARNARRAEDHLLSIAKQYGVGRLNRQWVSNYPDVCGYVYCIVGQVLNPHQVAGMQQGYCQPGYSHQQECCTIM